MKGSIELGMVFSERRCGSDVSGSLWGINSWAEPEHPGRANMLVPNLGGIRVGAPCLAVGKASEKGFVLVLGVLHRPVCESRGASHCSRWANEWDDTTWKQDPNLPDLG